MTEQPAALNADTAPQQLADTLARYQKLVGEQRDEMCQKGDTPEVREHWKHFMQRISGLNEADLVRRRMDAERLLRQNGVTYNVYGDPEGHSRTWQLDPIPLIIDDQEWHQIGEGLAQRARLLNCILQDVYSEQRLIKEGLLPAELLYGHRGFLRACHGMYQEGDTPLVLYAADLAKGPDGKMWVFGDRTQAPSGMGYALETRMAMTRVMGEEFRQSMVRRLSIFFLKLRNTLNRLAPHGKEAPRVVILTPGPRNETYFEHAYLASYLGYTLVQGDDLTVREGKVWMKSIDGLEQVDIILRRVDDHYCDPLELREDSHLGVPGLLQAVRSGEVMVVNALGSSFVESPGLYPFLDNINRKLFGEELRLASAASWWCGQEKERQYVLEHLDSLVIKTIDRRETTLFGGLLSEKEREALRDRIKAMPHLYVGQERLDCSTTPALIDGQLQPRKLLLRSFLVAEENGYTTMPGGLTRIAPDLNRFFISNQTGGLSKDTWILTRKPDKQISLWRQVRSRTMQGYTEGRLPSRSAENLYWVGRYSERSEAIVRLLRTIVRKVADFDDYGDESDELCLRQLLTCLTHSTATYPGFTAENPDFKKLLNAPEKEILSIALERDRIGGMVNTLFSFMQSAFNVRDLWSSDTWRIVDDIDERIGRLNKRRPTLYLLDNHIDALVDYLMAFSGLTAESMSHEGGWFMFDLGKRLERALQLITMLRTLLSQQQHDVVEHLCFEALLSTHESLITHRRRYRSAQQPVTVLILLLLDESHPRSVAYQVERMRKQTALLPRSSEGVYGRRLNEEERLLLNIRTKLQMANVEELAAPYKKTMHRRALVKLLDLIEDQLTQVSNILSLRYFTHIQTVRQLAPTAG